MFWQPDGEGAPALEPTPSAPTAVDAAGLRASLEAEHQRALEELEQEYEARLRDHERTVAALQAQLQEATAQRARLEERLAPAAESPAGASNGDDPGNGQDNDSPHDADPDKPHLRAIRE